MKKYSLLFLVYLFLFQGMAPAQIRSSKMDSLWQAAQGGKDSLERSDILLVYAQHVAAHSSDSALVFMDSLIGAYQNQGFSIALARAKSMKSWFLNFQARYEEAIRLGHEALAIQRKLKDTLGMAQSLNRIGVANLSFERYDQAEKYIAQALEYVTILKDTTRIDMMLNNLGAVAASQGKYEDAIAYYRRSLKLRYILGEFHWVAYSYFNIGSAYLATHEVDSAEKNLLLAVKTFKNKTYHGKVPAMVSLEVGELYREKGNYEQAMAYALDAQAKAEEINHTEIVVMARKTLAEVLYLQGHFEEAYQMNLSYQKIQNRLDSANNIAEVAEIEARYATAEKEAEIAGLQMKALQAENNAKQSWIITLAVVLAGSLIIAAIAVFFQTRFQRQAIMQANLNRKFSETRLTALRAQMNPHFIFNCINTTQGFVLTSKKKEAYAYLSKFARLLRMVLENSSKAFIPLEDELDQVKLYIELESIRFEEKFKYEVNVDPALESGVYEIPGMVIQPLVENAILHGLINRNDGCGELKLDLKKEGEGVLCEITDNGVGRTVAAGIKARKSRHYQSSAIPNIRERIEVLQKETNLRISFEIIDLIHNNQACGTKVQLVLPYR